jgi:hypothetical protein
MNYWILDIKQSGHDLREIMLFAPIITIAFSVFIFVWFFNRLSLHSAKASFRERSWKIFFSLYAVGSCWTFIFGICLLLVAPSQIHKSQSQTPAHLANLQMARNAELNKFQSDMPNNYSGHIVKNK